MDELVAEVRLHLDTTQQNLQPVGEPDPTIGAGYRLEDIRDRTPRDLGISGGESDG